MSSTSSTIDTSSLNPSITTDTSSPGNLLPPPLNQLKPLDLSTVTQLIENRPEQKNQPPTAMQLTPELLQKMQDLMSANQVSKEQKPSGFLTLFQGTFIMKKRSFGLYVS